MEQEAVTEKVFEVLKDLKMNLDETEETAAALERFTSLLETEREKKKEAGASGHREDVIIRRVSGFWAAIRKSFDSRVL